MSQRNESNRAKKRSPRPARGKQDGGAKSSKGAKPTKLRVIGGDMRGRPIVYHGEVFTRPMKDNIRENLFNILGRAVRGSIAFDLFAGTGALAIESISRGAVQAVAIEQSNRAAGFIRQTSESLDIESKLKILVGDAFRWSEQLLRAAEDPEDPMVGVPWIVFLCPPYALWEEELDQLNQIIERVLQNAPPGSVLVAEAEKKFEIERLPKGDWDIRVYGGTQLAFIEPATTCGLRL
ncbi:RsmD family RNA methyltransferase [Novipirellula artificiosorum]|uniref:Ribosomal RNA small subunit methyltransferase D n=1 Tax=Novipirellula artificiosorum TaxID=2528016 RepID=A0A5C6DAY3_9BACT|nr:RsmD family RNA methyltransferase [Novipirellula artificiosorum]TWU33315.1 Ribosomal RNA small subunit methyltransferase D [Novipirellula artificiosorum]